jgi:hypothetical protein
MKRQIIEISFLGMLALLSVGLVFYVSCDTEDNCSQYHPLSSAEEAFICYTQGNQVIFKNDTTNIIDTLVVKDRYIQTDHFSGHCSVDDEVISDFKFSHLASFGLDLWHGQSPTIWFGGVHSTYNFPLVGSFQTFTINSTTYNDVYSVQTDSTTIVSNGDKQDVPWKMYYSKSKGFVRFFMVNRQTWSKQ